MGEFISPTIIQLKTAGLGACVEVVDLSALDLPDWSRWFLVERSLNFCRFLGAWKSLIYPKRNCLKSSSPEDDDLLPGLPIKCVGGRLCALLSNASPRYSVCLLGIFLKLHKCYRVQKLDKNFAQHPLQVCFQSLQFLRMLFCDSCICTNSSNSLSKR